MRILITGATGLLGRRLVARLVRDGHTVTALSRRPDQARADLPDLADAWSWRQGEVTPPMQALDCDVVAHLAGETVAGRWTAAKKDRILRTRREGTRELVEAIAAAPSRPSALISASAVGYYGERGDEDVHDDDGAGQGFLSEVCQAWEQEAQGAEASGLRVLCMRMGLVLDPDGGLLGESLPLARAGLGGPLGSGRQWWPWVHRDDVIEAWVAAITGDDSGVWNVTSPGAVRQKAFATTLGRILGRPSFLPAPAFVLRLVLGGFADEPLLSRKVLPSDAVAHVAQHAELEPALRDLLGLPA
jgi:uncharacterized protein